MFVAVDETLFEHPKALRLCAALQNENGWAYVVRLWRWAMRYAKDGDLSRYEPAEIEHASGWRGNPGVFYAAAVRAGFIDEDPRRVHDWMEHNGKWVAKADRDRKRMADRRLSGRKETVVRPSREHRADVAGTS